MMSLKADQLLNEINATEDEELAEMFPSLIDRIKGLSIEDQTALLQTIQSDPRLKSVGKEHRRMQSVLTLIFHAVGVRTIESDEERVIRNAIRDQLSKLNGDPEAYRALEWVPSETLLGKG